MDGKSSYRETRTVFVRACEHVYFCCIFGHFNLGVFKNCLTPEPSGDSKNCTFWHFFQNGKLHFALDLLLLLTQADYRVQEKLDIPGA